MVGLARKWMVGAIIPKGDLYFLSIKGNYAGVAMAAQKLKQIAPDS